MHLLTDLPKTSATTPERKALIAILHVVAEGASLHDNVHVSWHGTSKRQHEALLNIKRLAMVGLKGAAD